MHKFCLLRAIQFNLEIPSYCDANKIIYLVEYKLRIWIRLQLRPPSWVSIIGHISVTTKHICNKFGMKTDIGHTRTTVAQYVPPLTKLTRAHQEMRYPNVSWHIILSVYLFTTELDSHFWDIPLSNAYLLHIMDTRLPKAPCVSCYYPLSIFLA